MMTGATADYAAHVQQMQLVTSIHSCRNVADDPFQRPPPPQPSAARGTRIDLRETAGGKFEHVVGCAVGERAYHDDIAGLWRARKRNDGIGAAEIERRSRRTDLVSIDNVNFRFHFLPPKDPRR